MTLIGLHRDCFSSWCAQLPEGSTLVVQPLIKGYAIGLRYKYGQLVYAYSRDSHNVIENIRSINSIPLRIDDSLKVEVELEGVLYSPSNKLLCTTEPFHFNSYNRIVLNENLSFLAFRIYHSKNNELSDLTQLQKWGFEIPITLRTDDPVQVKRWHAQWMKNELFTNIPTNGIVAKCNSYYTKNFLGLSHSSPKWSFALTTSLVDVYTDNLNLPSYTFREI